MAVQCAVEMKDDTEHRTEIRDTGNYVRSYHAMLH